jgi:selenocysteine-specific elongation factor
VSGDRCAVNLTQLQTSEIQRGDWLVSDRLARASSSMTLDLELLQLAPRLLKHGSSVHWHHGASDVLGKILLRHR